MYIFGSRYLSGKRETLLWKVYSVIFVTGINNCYRSATRVRWQLSVWGIMYVYCSKRFHSLRTVTYQCVVLIDSLLERRVGISQTISRLHSHAVGPMPFVAQLSQNTVIHASIFVCLYRNKVWDPATSAYDIFICSWRYLRYRGIYLVSITLST